MHPLRARMAAFVAALTFSLPAAATPFSTDFTDLWWNPAESGWGMNLVQQQDVLFATLFVYGPDNTSRWYVASALRPVDSVAGTQVFSGTLYQTTGPYFGAATFDPAAVTPAAVGTMTVTFTSATSGTLAYTIGSVTVTKSISRQTFAPHNMAGDYIGGLSALGTACATGGERTFVVSDRLAVTHEGAAVTIRIRNPLFDDQDTGCDFAGTWRQDGRLGTVFAGQFSCNVRGIPANSGVFTLTEVDVGVNGLTARFQGSDQFCNYDNGTLGGARAGR